MDLLATNGHIDDLTAYGRPYRMRTLLYWNQGTGRFREIPPERAGPFFSEKALGRGLAVWDWNRDGREDAVISFLDRPVALLTNTTPTNGHFLALDLCGFHSARDAIGTTVQIKTGEKIITRQLTAGGGYQASNSHRLIIGLGTADAVEELQIEWPSGEQQTFRDLPVDRELLILESSNLILLLPKPGEE